MGHTPYGYLIENGRAVIDVDVAVKIRKLYGNYLSGMSLETAAKKAGIRLFHGAVKRLMLNAHYLGDDFYPAIIGEDTYEQARKELQKRASLLRRTSRMVRKKNITVPTRFYFLDVPEHFDLPAEQAEYMYSRIECEAVD